MMLRDRARTHKRQGQNAAALLLQPLIGTLSISLVYYYNSVCLRISRTECTVLLLFSIDTKRKNVLQVNPRRTVWCVRTRSDSSCNQIRLQTCRLTALPHHHTLVYNSTDNSRCDGVVIPCSRVSKHRRGRCHRLRM